jgi:hypothetical protein
MVPPTSVHHTHVSGIQILCGSQIIKRVVSSVGCLCSQCTESRSVAAENIHALTNRDAYSKKLALDMETGVSGLTEESKHFLKISFIKKNKNMVGRTRILIVFRH